MQHWLGPQRRVDFAQPHGTCMPLIKNARPIVRHDKRVRRRFALCLAVISSPLVLLVGCASPSSRPKSSSSVSDISARVVRLIPQQAADRQGWASDIAVAMVTLDIDPTPSHQCAALAVAEQESNFVADPAVPGLGKIALDEIYRRAQAHDIPQLLVRAALAVHSSTGKNYADRLAAVRTERELSLIFEDLIGRGPLGQRLFADANPVHTGGPMQVSVTFAEQHAKEHPYPYPVDGSIRHEVFSRRGGIYFGIAHLLGYPVSYDRMIFRFADFNAGFYASRNAAFQSAVATLTGTPLALDGDLINYDGDTGKTEIAVRSLAAPLGMSDSQIHHALEQSETFDFEKGDLYTKLYALADRKQSTPLPHAMLPRIELKSPKITRKLSTQWFAERVEERYRKCLARVPAEPKREPNK
jgi:Protein of unknown function (DUF1615)